MISCSQAEASSLRFSEAATRSLILELVGAMAFVPVGNVPAVTDTMKRAGAEILASAVKMPPEELVTLVYEVMAPELDVVRSGDKL